MSEPGAARRMAGHTKTNKGGGGRKKRGLDGRKRRTEVFVGEKKKRNGESHKRGGKFEGRHVVKWRGSKDPGCMRDIGKRKRKGGGGEGMLLD